MVFAAQEDRNRLIPVIEKAIELIECGPCKEACARNSSGGIVAYDSKKATRFSIYGALHRAEQLLLKDGRLQGQATAAVSNAAGRSLVQANEDVRSVKELVQICRDAIKTLKKEEEPAETEA